MRNTGTPIRVKSYLQVSPVMLLFAVVACTALAASADPQQVHTAGPRRGSSLLDLKDKIKEAAPLVGSFDSIEPTLPNTEGSTFTSIVAVEPPCEDGIQTLDLSAAKGCAVFATTAATIAGKTTIHGALCTPSAGVAVTESAEINIIGGKEQGSLLATTAQQAFLNARQDAESRNLTQGGDFPPTGLLGGKSLKPGVYETATALDLSGHLEFDAEGDADAVWIIRSGGALTTAASSTMTITKFGNPNNIFFVLTGAATFGAQSLALGTYMATAAITGGSGAELGLLFAGEAVTLSANVVTGSVSIAVPDDHPTRRSAMDSEDIQPVNSVLADVGDTSNNLQDVLDADAIQDQLQTVNSDLADIGDTAGNFQAALEAEAAAQAAQDAEAAAQAAQDAEDAAKEAAAIERKLAEQALLEAQNTETVTQNPDDCDDEFEHRLQPLVLDRAEGFALVAEEQIILRGPVLIHGGICNQVASQLVQSGQVKQTKGDLLVGGHEAAELFTVSATIYKNLIALPVSNDLPDQFHRNGRLGNVTLTPGVYLATCTLHLEGNLIFDAQGDVDAVWIIQSHKNLVVLPNAGMMMENGGQAQNIFFGIQSNGRFGVDSEAIGNYMIQGHVIVGAGARVGPIRGARSIVVGAGAADSTVETSIGFQSEATA
jgi:hypothetical protein